MLGSSVEKGCRGAVEIIHLSIRGLTSNSTSNCYSFNFSRGVPLRGPLIWGPGLPCPVRVNYSRLSFPAYCLAYMSLYNWPTVRRQEPCLSEQFASSWLMGMEDFIFSVCTLLGRNMKGVQVLYGVKSTKPTYTALPWRCGQIFSTCDFYF
jgi:hypothetical protein